MLEYRTNTSQPLFGQFQKENSRKLSCRFEVFSETERPVFVFSETQRHRKPGVCPRLFQVSLLCTADELRHPALGRAAQCGRKSSSRRLTSSGASSCIK